MIVKGGKANSLTYTLTQLESFRVTALSADIDATAAVSNSYCDAIFRDNAGLLIARSRSSQQLLLGLLITMTFAPDLPDSETLANFFGSSVITSGLTATVLPPGGSVTVTVQDPAALVTGFRMWAIDSEDAEGDFDGNADELGAWMFVPGPGG